MKPIMVEREQVDVTVDHNGVFHCEWNGQEYTADSHAGLQDKIRDARRQQKLGVAVPFTLLQQGRAVPCVATGIHQVNGNVLYREEGVKGGKQLDRWRQQTLHRLTDAEAAEYEQMTAQIRELERRRDKFVSDHKLASVKAEVQRAITAARGEGS